ncbi:M20/M25/M40 family metallo-hydrolase [Stigmatella aurantiaca]|uniref:Peptidase, M20 family n=1 Tax=Stigmatella aurantiaca (strain DW4/3-1) TaxID=378806 RepID=Q096S1_STIAD|nr:M20/M25/M40 family metallo-hydrolase [Stigmatella aurantiaca]ADO68554.1 Peptidase, M20 family [Stigmatella aurantiaca DW4/3-1]EAU67698.1 putative hydrolase [Stigmatella aurantiaca DW4/3-1]
MLRVLHWPLLLLLLPTWALAQGPKEPKKEPKPRPPVDCKLAGPQRAAQFSAEALPGRPLSERYAEYVGTCGLDDVVALTQQLVRFKTVSGELPAAKSPGVAALGRFLRKWAQAHGFDYRVVGNQDVFELSWGTDAPHLGLLFHADVAPATASEWRHDPFDPQVMEGKLYGRGVSDGKGPLATALVSLAMAQEMGLKPWKGRVLVLIGNGEQGGRKGMAHYVQTQPLPTHAVSVDAEYPVVVAQSGFAVLNLEAPLRAREEKDSGRLVAVDASAGEGLTLVPASASLELLPAQGTSSEQGLALVQKALEAVRRERPSLAAEVKLRLVPGVAAGSRIVLSVRGRTAPSAQPEKGQNALWDLSVIAGQLPLSENGLSAMLRTIARRLEGDHYGERLGIAGQDLLMGPLVVAPTLLQVKDGKVSLRLHLHRPRNEEGTEDFHKGLDHAVALITQETDGWVKEGGGRVVGEPYLANTSGPLVAKLLEVYKLQRGMGEGVKPISFRGETDARLFPRGVDFGPRLPGEPRLGQAPDEFISLERLALNTRMLAAALQALVFSPNAP